MAERLEVDLIVKAIAEGFDKLASEQKKTGKAAEKHEGRLKKLGKTLGGFVKVMGVAVLGLAAFGIAAKKAFDVARLGAVVEQTRESFDRLVRSLGEGPEILEKLRRAALGTVDDMTLMSSVMTLVAGAGDELARKLLTATPQLLEIAKAANKLNPALGTTAFFFESIATGIKRAQPLILDNLGLTIKVGAANIAMAKELGKSVDALTAEEKAIAILNDTMRAGAVIIDQVGGSTAALTDDFDELTTSIKNAKDAFAVQLKDQLIDQVKGVNKLLEAYVVLIEAFERGNITDRERSELLFEILTLQTDAAAVTEELTREIEQQDEEWMKINESMAGADAHMVRLAEIMGTLIIDTKRFREPLREVARATMLTGIAFKEMGAAATAGFREVDVAIGASIEKTIDQLKFVAGGGAEIARVVAEITAAVETGKIMPDDAIPLYEQAQELTLQIQQNTGLITHEEAIGTAEDWGIALEGPVSNVQTIRDDLAGLTSGEHVIRVRIEVEGGGGLGISGGGGGGGFTRERDEVDRLSMADQVETAFREMLEP